MEYVSTFSDMPSGGVLPVDMTAPPDTEQMAASAPQQTGTDAGARPNQNIRAVEPWVVTAPAGVQWGSPVTPPGMNPGGTGPSTNWTETEWGGWNPDGGDWGWSGGGVGDGAMGWDWGPGGNDWAGDGLGLADNWGGDNEMQVVEIVGQRMTLWEKIAYDMEEMSGKIASVVDNAIDTFAERGFISAGYQNGFGVSVTVDANKDLYVGIVGGRAGPSFALGVTPEGVGPSSFLSKWGVSAVTPIGVGITGNDSGISPIIGTAGFSVGYNWNVSQAWRDGHQFQDVVDEAGNYFRDVYGLPQ